MKWSTTSLCAQSTNTPNRGRSFLEFAKVAFKTVVNGTDVKARLVDYCPTSRSASPGGTPGPGINGSLVANPSLGSPYGRPAQNEELRRFELKLAQAMELLYEQRDDIDRSLKGIEGLKQGLILVQAFIGRLETNGYTHQVDHSDSKELQALRTDIDNMRRQLYSLETASSSISRPVKTKQPQTAKMTGPLARRPLITSSNANSSISTTTIRESTSSIVPSIQSLASGINPGLKDIMMHDIGSDRSPINPDGYNADQTTVAQAQIQSSPGILGRSSSSAVEPMGQNGLENVVDKLMGPPLMPTERPGTFEPVPLVRPSIESAPRSSVSAAELDTQEYLRRTARRDDTEDTEYQPSTRIPSPGSSRNIPASIEVQSSLDNILDPATPLRWQHVNGASPGMGRGSGRSRKSWVDDRRQTPEWERPEWAGPSETYQTTIRNTTRQPRGTRRGVSGGIGPSRAPKRQKKMSYEATGFERERDEEGYLLRADGRRDMRSARYRKSGGEEPAINKPNGNAPNGSGYSEQHQRIMAQIYPYGRPQPATEENRLIGNMA